MIPVSWLVKAIWVDYSLAVALTVVLPLALLIWAFAVGLRPLIQLLIVYWRVSSLLAVTVYLMIGGLPISFLSGAIVGVVYLRMLGRGVAELGKSRSRLGVTRLALFVGLIVLATQVKSLQILPIFLGFMTYKVTLLIYLVQTLTRLSSSA